MKEQLISLLSKNNSKERGIFIPISVEEYVSKITKYSTIIPYIQQGEIVAFISYYNNDAAKENSFLTMLLVSEQCQGRGIGKSLIELSLRDVEKAGFKNYSLEVLKSNSNAIALYKSYGFNIKEDKGEIWVMEKILRT